jgi:hypothetical protein
MTRYTGPAMTLGNMRQNGVRSILVECVCGHKRECGRLARFRGGASGEAAARCRGTLRSRLSSTHRLSLTPSKVWGFCARSTVGACTNPKPLYRHDLVQN